jgi:hypothetical protein
MQRAAKVKVFFDLEYNGTSILKTDLVLPWHLYRSQMYKKESLFRNGIGIFPVQP